MNKIINCFLVFVLTVFSISIVNADEHLAPIEDLPTAEEKTEVANNIEIVDETIDIDKNKEIQEHSQDENETKTEKGLFETLYDGDRAIYSVESGKWYVGEPLNDEDIVITKNLIEGTGSYSQYYYSDESLAMTFCSNYEFIKDGVFVVVNNENLKYSKLVYNDGVFEEVPIELLDLQVMFPDAELVKLSGLDADGKMWISKLPFKKKVLFFVNDTDKYYYKLTAKMKKLQPTELRSYVVIPHYGFYTFTHLGEHKGKIRIYTR